MTSLARITDIVRRSFVTSSSTRPHGRASVWSLPLPSTRMDGRAIAHTGNGRSDRPPLLLLREQQQQQQPRRRRRWFSSSSDNTPTIKERFAMPDRDKELHLASLQGAITEDYKRGDFTEALKRSQSLLVETEQHFGREHPATASAYNNVGLMQKLLGDYVGARKNYLHAMRIYGQVVGRDHASYAMTLHNLGSLNKSQVHFDTSLKATERLALVEAALEYFEEAWFVRKAELGEEHPHTVATRSAVGSTLAAQVLYQHKLVVAAGSSDTNDDNGGGSSSPSSTSSRKQYISLNPEAITKQQWRAAQEHLVEALQTSIDSPRGKRIGGKNNSSSGGINNNNKRKGKDRTKKQAPPPPPSLQTQTTDSNNNEKQIETLSAASAGQNLAVFLKALAMTENPYNEQHLRRAKELYLQVQQVRSQLLPANHPDLYSTKYSLAELLEVMGEEEEANALRQEIVDSYHPPSEEELAREEEAAEIESAAAAASLKDRIVVEKTVVPKS